LALVKINNVELRTLFPGEPSSASTSTLLLRARERWPVRRWIVTDGGGLIWFGEAEGTVASMSPPRVAEVSPTGSGDVFLACVLEFHFRRGQPLAQAVERALPYAAANAAHPGVAEFPLPEPA
jgi:sugar/nucleoside kinase (ribokinase family)